MFISLVQKKLSVIFVFDVSTLGIILHFFSSPSCYFMLVHVSRLSFFFFYFYYYVYFISFYFIIIIILSVQVLIVSLYFKYEGCMLIFSITILVEVSFTCYLFLHCFIALLHCVLFYIVLNFIPMCFFMCCFIYQTLTFLFFCFISSHSLLSLCLSLIFFLFDVCMFFHHSTFVLKILEFIFL